MADCSVFSALPDDASLWIHTADASLEGATQTALLNRLSEFMETWTSHQHPVHGAATVLHDRFLVVAAASDGPDDISGCGIDALTHAIDDAAAALGLSWVPALHVLYRAPDGTVTAVPRRVFQQRAEEGLLTLETPVFDPSLCTLGALRAGRLERPARASWHAQLLPDAAPSPHTADA
jgi:hypothetical protein